MGPKAIYLLWQSAERFASIAFRASTDTVAPRHPPNARDVKSLAETTNIGMWRGLVRPEKGTIAPRLAQRAKPLPRYLAFVGEPSSSALSFMAQSRHIETDIGIVACILFAYLMLLAGAEKATLSSFADGMKLRRAASKNWSK